MVTSGVLEEVAPEPIGRREFVAWQGARKEPVAVACRHDERRPTVVGERQVIGF